MAGLVLAVLALVFQGRKRGASAAAEE
jgi:hypothetical protein